MRRGQQGDLEIANSYAVLSPHALDAGTTARASERLQPRGTPSPRVENSSQQFRMS